MTPFALVTAIVCLALSTFATRAGILLLGERFSLSPRAEAALRFAPACALTALIVPEVIYPGGTLDLTLANPRWPATLAAIAFLIWRHSIGGGIAAGMAVYAVMRLLY
jgi:branched-subunit amino acid transport protein